MSNEKKVVSYPGLKARILAAMLLASPPATDRSEKIQKGQAALERMAAESRRRLQQQRGGHWQIERAAEKRARKADRMRALVGGAK